MRDFYNLKKIVSGDRIEIYKYSIAQEINHKGRNKTGRKGKGKAKMEKNRKEVLNKARNMIIRLANCNTDLTTFMSLTYADNMQNLKASKGHLNILFKRLQEDFLGFKYLYVLEFQSRGAIHYHVLCNFPVLFKTAGPREFKPEFQKILENQFKEMYWPHGFVDIRNLKEEGNTNAGLYVSTYLIEDLFKLDLDGAKCYGYSRNLNKPKESTTLTEKDPAEVLQSFSRDHDLVYASNYGMQYENEGKLVNGNVNYFDLYKKRDDHIEF